MKNMCPKQSESKTSRKLTATFLAACFASAPVIFFFLFFIFALMSTQSKETQVPLSSDKALSCGCIKEMAVYESAVCANVL